MYQVRTNSRNDHKYITFPGVVPNHYVFGSGSGYKAGEPCTIKAQLIRGNVWVTIISGKVGHGYEPQLLKRIPADGVKADDYESIYKLAQQALWEDEMGDCNFGTKWHGLSRGFGMLPYYPTEEDLIEYRRDMDHTDDTNLDELRGLYMDDQHELVYNHKKWAEDELTDRIDMVIRKLWQFGDMPNGYGIPFPYELKIENGYHEGWRAILESRYCFAHDRADNTEWLAYCDLLGRDTDEEKVFISAYGAPNVSFENFKAHVRKVSDAVVWAFENYANANSLDLVWGGWRGSSRLPEKEDYTEIEWESKWEEMFPEYK